MQDYTRDILIEGIDELTSDIIPDQYEKSEYESGDHERVDIGVELKKWLMTFVQERDFQTGPVNVTESEGSVRRFVIEIEEEPNSFLIAIHDPMRGHPKPAESVTGVDYGVEYPVTENQDRFVLVQTKRLEATHSIPPKQFFAMGSVYMFGQYLVRSGKAWDKRFEEGINYTNNFENPHNEFLFVKYAEEDLYIPVSGVLNTHEFNHGNTTLNECFPKSSAEGLRIDHNNVSERLIHTCESKEPHFPSFADFRTALTGGEIGLHDRKSIGKTERKAVMFASLARILNRPNIALFEVENDVFDEVSNRLSE